MAPDRFGALWRSLEPIGRGTDGYHRFSWTYPDLACREWFAEEAADRGMSVETDGNGNLWAWLGDPALGDAVVTGSHFDSVPGGGGYDGALGIASVSRYGEATDPQSRWSRPMTIGAATSPEATSSLKRSPARSRSP